jgi:3',5'-cyclic-nucleotide phosphodiesterase
MKNKSFLYSLLIFFSFTAYAQDSNYTFKVIPLGVRGGMDESNLSCYMLAAEGTDNYVCLDAGTVYYGIKKAIDNGLFNKNALYVLKNDIKGYLISHPHLDHVAGLIINSPADTSKNIYGIASCINVLKKDYFTWQSWPNFADAGEKPLLNKYHYKTLEPLKEMTLDNTSMTVRAFKLSHSSPYESTAFLIKNNKDFILYLGDTGADTIEKTHDLYELWQYCSPIIKAKKLKAIFIEVSYDNGQPEKQLFGHLTPHLLMKEMNVLNNLCGSENLKEVPVVITHTKPSEHGEELIGGELQDENKEGLKFIFPRQGQLLHF